MPKPILIGSAPCAGPPRASVEAPKRSAAAEAKRRRLIPSFIALSSRGAVFIDRLLRDSMRNPALSSPPRKRIRIEAGGRGMPLSHLEHYLIQTDDLEATRRWYVEVLGMREGPHPDFGLPVHWLYIGERDVLHLTQGGTNVSEARKRYL